MKRLTLRKDQVKEFNNQIESMYGIEGFFHKKEQVVLLDDKIITKSGKPVFFLHKDKLIPLLKLVLSHDLQHKIKTITVDMGAVKFVANGADIMRPGIVEWAEDIQKNDIVIIIDQNNKKPLAIGKALLSSEDLENTDSGKCIENLHHVGDELWKA